MGTTSVWSRFRVSPVELVIFSAVTVFCMHSLYNLFYDRQGIPGTAGLLTANKSLENRVPASASVTSLDTTCDNEGTTTTNAAKARLSGPLCEQDETPISKTQVTNQANSFSATVFMDLTAKKYSTDYIPLVTGNNPIEIEFLFQDGRSFTRKFGVTRN